MAEYIMDACLAGQNGWLAPDGKFYPCGFMEHDELVYEIIGADVVDEWLYDCENLTKGVYEYLLDRNWVHLSAGYFDVGHTNDQGEAIVTPAQLRFINEWIEAHPKQYKESYEFRVSKTYWPQEA